MAHFFRDIRHGQIVFAGKIGKQEELGERDVPFVEFRGQVQNAAPLGENNEISKAVGVGFDRRTQCGWFHGWWYGSCLGHAWQPQVLI